MITKIAAYFGALMIVIGALGFVPGITTAEGHLLGLFHVNTAHNIVHLATGAIALGMAFFGERPSRWFFRVFGAVYGLVALLGALEGEGLLLGLIANNWADVVLHFVIAATTLTLGFFPQTNRVAPLSMPLPPAP